MEDRRAEAEARYVAGDMTLSALAQETGVPLNSLKRWCKSGGWVRKREKAHARAVRRAVTSGVGRRAKSLARLISASDEMDEALLRAARLFSQAMRSDEPIDIKALTDGDSRARNLLSVARGIESMAKARAQLDGIAQEREKADNNGLVIRLEADELEEASE